MSFSSVETDCKHTLATAHHGIQQTLIDTNVSLVMRFPLHSVGYKSLAAVSIYVSNVLSKACAAHRMLRL